MTPAEIIESTRVPGTKSVFFLGCFEKRVTVFSQQVRALNLISAIVDQSQLRSNGRVAIVGGGAAGLTAAVALAKLMPDLQGIHVYERLSEVLQLQQGSGRYLHPHNYDWPAASASIESAGLPLMNWRAGLARDVHRHLREQFDEAARGRIELRNSAQVKGVRPFERTSARVILESGAYAHETYDVVILSVGFGLERSLGGQTPSYWTVSEMESPILAPGIHEVFVSGNGDGGLVDFMLAALGPMTHQKICELITGFDMPAAKAQLELIEQEAWAPNADVDLFEAYSHRVIPLVPPAVIAEVQDRLRPNVRVRLHTNEARLFKKATAVLNRFGCALVLEADRNLGHDALTTTVGVEFEGHVPITGPIKLQGEASFDPYRRYLRLGPDSESNLNPFSNLVDLLSDAARNPSSTFRPETPELIPEAVEMFKDFHSPDAAVEVPIQNGDVASASLVISASNNGARVGGNVVADELGLVWREQRPVAIDASIGPNVHPQLLWLVARLGGHAPIASVYAKDRRGWDDALKNALRGRALPGNLGLQVQVEDVRDLPQNTAPTHPASGFIAAGHLSLDAETLATLDGAISNVLTGPEPDEFGWAIDPDLRTTMWERWGAWSAILEADASILRRFLLLLADAEDFQANSEAALVKVGPRAVIPHLLKPTIFALAFAVGVDRPVVPAGLHPGNLKDSELSGHACGVSWIEGRDIGHRVAERAWSTSIVLLAELKVAVTFLRAEPRMDEMPGAPPLVGDVSEGDRPIIIGADDAFVEALEQGAAAVSSFFHQIVDDRIAQVSATIEGVK